MITGIQKELINVGNMTTTTKITEWSSETGDVNHHIERESDGIES